MELREEIVNGKKRIIFVRHANGEDVSKEVVKKILGEGWELKDEQSN